MVANPTSPDPPTPSSVTGHLANDARVAYYFYDTQDGFWGLQILVRPDTNTVPQDGDLLGIRVVDEDSGGVLVDATLPLTYEEVERGDGANCTTECRWATVALPG